MSRTIRIIAAFFGALLVVAFFLPWFEASFGIVKLNVTGYEIFESTANLKKMAGYERSPLDYFILVFPATGVIAVVASGLIRVPHLTLAFAMASVAYIVFRIADFGLDIVKKTAGHFGLGLWIALVCVLVLFITASIQAASGSKKKK